MLAKALLLKQLYLRRLIGEKYCQAINYKNKNDSLFANKNLSEIVANCTLCELSKNAQNKIYGQIAADSKLTFITLKPTLPHTASSEMLDKIAKNVFGVESYNLLSLIKCATITEPQDSHTIVCKEFLNKQLIDLESSKFSGGLVVLFGISVAKIVLNVDDELPNLRGRIFDDKNHENLRKFIVTYGISELLRNSTLKKAALADFQNAKERLEWLKK